MKMKNITFAILLILLPFVTTMAQLKVNVDVNPENSGTVSGGRNYFFGSTARLEATPEIGYTFTEWTGDLTGINNPDSLIVDSDKFVTANFIINNYNINVSLNPQIGGTVSGDSSYNHGDLVKLIATPTLGYKFVNWTEGGFEVSTDSIFLFNALSDQSFEANFILKEYTISAISLPNEGGQTFGSGNYFHGDEVTLTAEPSIGYSFINWTENGSEVSVDSIYIFTADSNRIFEANYILNNYSIQANSVPIEGGVIIGVGEYNHGDEVTLTAETSIGYSFINWTENGSEVSIDSTYIFNADSPRVLEANFSLNNYSIQANSVPAEGGVIIGAGEYNYNDEVTLTANPSTGFTFINWTEGGEEVSLDSIYIFNADSSRVLEANFSLNNYSIQANPVPAEGGSVEGAGEYAHGDEIQLIPHPEIGWDFINWTDSISVVDPDSIQIFIAENNSKFFANFKKKIYQIETSAEPNLGGISIGDGNYEHDSIVTIISTPNIGWDFVGWFENDSIIYTDSLITFSAENKRSLIANFKLKEYNISASSTPQHGGIVTGDTVYTHGTEVNLVAHPSESLGYKFVNWTKNEFIISTDSILTFIAEDEEFIVANFDLKEYEVDLLTYPVGAGELDGTGVYKHGDQVTLKSNPKPGWLFANWTEGDTNVSSDPEFSFTIDKNKVITANFANELYSIETQPEPSQSGFISGSGTFYYGQTATLIPAANLGWEFLYWTENKNVISTDSILSIDVTKNQNIEANFRLKNYSITCSVFPNDAGFTSGCGLSYYKQEMTLTATENNGYKFINWTENGDVISDSLVISFLVDGDRNVVANFDIISDININSSMDVIPDEFYISNAYPNPFNPSTKVNFGLPESSNVKIFIANVNGQIVRTVLSGVTLSAGNYHSSFNAENLSSGIYLYIFLAQSDVSDKNFKKIEKLILLK